MMKIGMAEVNITPPLGGHIPGYFHVREASGVMDDLYAKTMVVESNGTLLAFATLDMISIEEEATVAIRQSVAERTSIPAEHVMISCTHTHTGVPRPGTPMSELIYEVLAKRVADGIVMAYEQRQVAKVSFGVGHEADIAFNRRFWLKDGTFKTNPGVRNPNIDRVAGPIDPEVLVMRVDDEDGRTIGIVSNYACHTDTVGGTLYSGDFPAHVSEILKTLIGKDTVSLFMQGACGNINHVDVTGKFNTAKGTHHIRMGEILGAEIYRVQRKTAPSDAQLDIAVKSKMVPATNRLPNEEELARARKIVEELEQIPTDQITNGQIQQKRIAQNVLLTAEQGLVTRNYEVQVANIGELAIIALPAEIFVEYGLEIKEKSPFPMNMINELSNGSGNGYVCTREAYSQGGYEPSGHKFEIGAGEKFVAAALELLEELYQNRPVQ